MKTRIWVLTETEEIPRRETVNISSTNQRHAVVVHTFGVVKDAGLDDPVFRAVLLDYNGHFNQWMRFCYGCLFGSGGEDVRPARGETFFLRRDRSVHVVPQFDEFGILNVDV